MCNITCANCYIESSPRNDRLVYLSLAEVKTYLDEIERDRLPTRLIGFTGGEPFMNPCFPAMLEESLSRGFETLTLTNAMRPMMRRQSVIASLAATYGRALRLRVSLDDCRAEFHDRQRGKGSFAKAMEGLPWLASLGVPVEVAGRRLAGDTEEQHRLDSLRRRSMNRRDALSAMCGLAAALLSKPLSAETSDMAFDALLARYVRAHADGVNRVDYVRWKASTEDLSRVNGYIRELAAHAPSRMARNAAFAFWCNLYNAITLKVG